MTDRFAYPTRLPTGRRPSAIVGSSLWVRQHLAQLWEWPEVELPRFEDDVGLLVLGAAEEQDDPVHVIANAHGPSGAAGMLDVSSTCTTGKCSGGIALATAPRASAKTPMLPISSTSLRIQLLSAAPHGVATETPVAR